MITKFRQVSYRKIKNISDFKLRMEFLFWWLVPGLLLTVRSVRKAQVYCNATTQPKCSVPTSSGPRAAFFYEMFKMVITRGKPEHAIQIENLYDETGEKPW